MALLPEQVAVQWNRGRGIRKVHVVAVLSALVAAATVFSLFNAFGVLDTTPKAERQLIASVDLRLGTPALSFARGEAQARLDLEADVLKLQKAGPATSQSKADIARAERLKKRHGITWAFHGDAVTPLTEAWAEGYNSVAKAEIERRHGQAFLDRVIAGQDP